MFAAMYEVWVAGAKGLEVGPKFRLFQDARRYVDTHSDEASFVVRDPTGEWALIVRREGDRLELPRVEQPIYDIPRRAHVTQRSPARAHTPVAASWPRFARSLAR